MQLCNITAFKSTQLCGLIDVRLQLAVPLVQYERRIVRAGCCGGFVAKWLWRLQSNTLGLSPAVASFFSSPFSPSRLSSNETSITYSSSTPH